MAWRSDITRDGFSSAYGRFYTANDRIERMNGDSLRSLFLPRLTPGGQKVLRDHYNFVRGQLQHYGVAFDERQFTGNGTQLLKKTLQEGGCDSVPPHILELEAQMHRDWLNTCSLELLSSHPQWVIEKHFGSDLRPDRTITTTVIGVPFPRTSNYRVGQMREAAGRVVGLHHDIGMGPRTKTVFMGWDKAAVEKAAKGHAEKEREEVQAAEQKRQSERAKLHADYCCQARKVASPVGNYIVDCEAIENVWNDAKDLRLRIDTTDRPGVFIAEFDFVIYEGVMIICADKVALEQYCSEEDESSEEDGWDEESTEDERSAVGTKRKASTPRRGGASKKSKGLARKYLLKARGRETGEGEIMDFSDNGTITFKDGKFTSLVGKADMSMIGRGVVFTARKVSDIPDSQGKAWADYSERQHERERVDRWH